MREARETLQDAILERLGIPTTDADINAILTALSSAGLAVVPVEQAKIPTEVRTYVMHDNHTFTHLEESSLDQLLARARLMAKADPSDVMLCPIMVMSGKNEVRRVGEMVTFWREERNVEAWYNAAKEDPDIPRLLAKRTPLPPLASGGG